MKRLSIADVSTSEILSKEEKKNVVGGFIKCHYTADSGYIISVTCNVQSQCDAQIPKDKTRTCANITL